MHVWQLQRGKNLRKTWIWIFLSKSKWNFKGKHKYLVEFFPLVVPLWFPYGFYVCVHVFVWRFLTAIPSVETTLFTFCLHLFRQPWIFCHQLVILVIPSLFWQPRGISWAEFLFFFSFSNEERKETILKWFLLVLLLLNWLQMCKALISCVI